MAVNIPEDKLSTLHDDHSNAVIPYKLPTLLINAKSPSSHQRKVYFLLLQQSNAVDILRLSDLTLSNSSTCSTPSFKGRCKFDVQKFIMDNHMVLRGVSWITAIKDSLTKYNMVKKGEAEEGVCKDDPHYSRPCTTTKNPLTAAPRPRSTASSLKSSYLTIYIMASSCLPILRLLR